MKTKLVLTVILISFLFSTGCSNNDDSVQESESVAKNSSASKGSSVINQEYSQAQAEVLETFGAIAESITLGAGEGLDSEYMDQLISFHAYGDKFVEFNGGNVYNSSQNAANERQFFGETVTKAIIAPMEGTVKVAVYYGNVANLTFISNFTLTINGETDVHNLLITLLFVKTKGEWKIVHEHHSAYTP
ncbi:MAG: hypothetical protein GQ552_00550 [Flavobacteriaceae bacterium]|nr:hypothetical protein [Flavobacteriaceae bacterium]